jgi:hypothetical protein
MVKLDRKPEKNFELSSMSVANLVVERNPSVTKTEQKSIYKTMKKYIFILGISVIEITTLNAQIPDLEDTYRIPLKHGYMDFRVPEGLCMPLFFDTDKKGFQFSKPIFEPNFIGGNIEFNLTHSSCVLMYSPKIDFKVNNETKLFISGANGNVGVNTDNPQAQFHVQGNSYLNGNVGIGIIPNVALKLDVAGTVRACEVRVSVTQGCDYVFANDYKLMSLSDLSKFIGINKHLPDVAPATEMEAEGINVSEMNTLLLRKIEKLTLYMIELQKQIDELKQQKGCEK